MHFGTKMTALAAAGLSLASGLSRAGVPQIGSTSQPNVLIIVTDDQRDGLGVMPWTRHYFVKRGVRFPNAFVTTPLCCPSRSTIMTGQYVHNNHVYTEGDAPDLNQKTTLQYYLQQAGYRTALFGKYLNSWNLHRAPPYFTRWSFFRGSSTAYVDGHWNDQGTVKVIPEYSTSYIGDRAVGFIRHSASSGTTKPWFLYLATAAPHNPFLPSKRYARTHVRPWPGNPALYESDRTDKPPWVQHQHATEQRGQRIRAKQFRTLRSVDVMVRRIFATLQRSHEANNTLAFFISDNGFLWGEHGLLKKTHPYLPSVQVPMMMRWPGHLAVDNNDDRLVANVDIGPTVIDATGASTDLLHPMDGRSLLDGSWTRDRMFLEYFRDHPAAVDRFGTPSWASLYTPEHQYVEYYGQRGSTAPRFREYYNLVNDPWELVNLLGDSEPNDDPSQSEQSSLQQQLSHDRQCSGTTGPSACP
jgi:arylsulfatase A-like enzyme